MYPCMYPRMHGYVYVHYWTWKFSGVRLMYFKTESDLKASKMLENEFTPKLLQRDAVFVKNNCISLDKTFPVWMAIVLTSYPDN